MSADLAVVPKEGVPVLYQAAVDALATCVRVDEVHSWVAKAAALQEYARQAKDETLFKQSARIKARAMQREGQILEEFEAKAGKELAGRGVGGIKHLEGPTGMSARDAAAKEAGLSTHEKLQALRIARIPKEEFERAVESAEGPPSILELAERGKRKMKAPTRKTVPGDDQLRLILAALARIRAGSAAAVARSAGNATSALKEIALFEKWLSTLKSQIKEKR